MRFKLYRWIQSAPYGWALGLTLLIRLMTLGAYPLMDTTEARYGEMARKMLETGNWLTPQFDYGIPFWGKPPLSIWLTAASFKFLGVHEFSARLPTYVIGLVIIWLIFKIAQHRQGVSFGWMASAIFATSLLSSVMIGTVIMDPALTLGTTLSMVGFWLAIEKKSRLWGTLFFIGLAIGLLAKGPVTLVLCGVPIGLWIIIHKAWRRCWQCIPVIKGSLLMLVLTLPWYVMSEYATPGFLEYFIIGEHWKRFTEPGWAGDLYGRAHRAPYGKIWLLALEAMLPWSLVVPVCLWKTGRQRPRKFAKQKSSWLWYLVLWMMTPMLFFTFSGNILMTYVLPAMPAFALLTTEILRLYLGQAKTENHSVQWPLSYAGFVVPSVLAVGLCVCFVANPWKSEDLLLARYHRLATTGETHLYYVPERPFSAEFYSKGKAEKLKGLKEVALVLKDRKQDFFAVRSYLVEAMRTRFGERIEEVGNSRRFVLFRARKL